MRRSERKQVSPDLGILSVQLMFAFQREVFATVAIQGHPEVRPRHGAVLAYLDKEGNRATDLAAQSGQHKQVIGTLVDELVALGYVERVPDPSDRRAKLVVPTERGSDLMKKTDAIAASIERRHAKLLGKDAFDEFKRSLQRVVELQRAWMN